MSNVNTRTVRPITIVVGGAWGSESKGAVCGYLAVKDDYDVAVRTGATNAGHSVEFRGRVYVNQMLPTAWVNPRTELFIGAGALVDVDILNAECRMIDEAFNDGSKVGDRLYIDYRAFIHTKSHAERSKASSRHHAMGATGKGCSEALIDRIRLRSTKVELGGDAVMTIGDAVGYPFRRDPNVPRLDFPGSVGDTEHALNNRVNLGMRIMLEGTQGQLLDLALGPYPYVTHKQTGPAVWMVEAGLSPALPTDIVMVVRTFPIRVAGNSGPMPLETSWPALTEAVNRTRARHDLPPIVAPWAIKAFEAAVREETRENWKDEVPTGSDGLDQHWWQPSDRVRYRAALSEINKAALLRLEDTTVAELRKMFEMTTVTKKLRRIAMLDTPNLAAAARQIRPHRTVVTFMNYVFPYLWNSTDPVSDVEHDWLRHSIESNTGSRVTLINRGPMMEHFIEVGR